jgi:hypothetical protein
MMTGRRRRKKRKKKVYIKNYLTGNIGRAVAELVEVLRYKPEGRGFDS